MADMQSYDIPLHDIKPIVRIEEYSLYYFLGISLFAVVLVLLLSYLLFSWLKKRNRYNKRREHFESLKTLDLKRTKESAYDITFYGATFKNDSLRHKESYDNLVGRLERYKYKKEVEGYDDETLGYIELYKGMIDV
ncbi:MAG: hypothetical protein PHO62_09460 [Sulfurimonas sp.]|uniref:hypothetical protein n=1 Tax=Sulfurimonas sp. TaxID=2022749 RepID=UPI002604A80A|nr:hypothetical protein [Sulfurimonas sp.]MDD5373634.1 hypothetical protein [Sulfurimonas sp.]